MSRLHSSSPVRRWSALVGAAIAGSLMIATPAALATVATPAIATVTFTAPGEHLYTVPDGVTRVDVVAIGGEGGASTIARGGRGGRIAATLDVTPGQTLYGEIGTRASGTTAGANGGGGAGGSTGECHGTPGAGGGATDVRTVGIGQPGSDESRVLVAGGGGGSGTLGTSDSTTDVFDANLIYGGHRGLGGGTPNRGGWGGANGVGGAGGDGGLTDATSTTGGRGAAGVAGAGDGCGGGGGGGYGGGGGGGAGSSAGDGGGGGGGGSLVPGGFPAGMATHGEAPSLSFTTPGLPAPAGPLSTTSIQSLRQSARGHGDGSVPFVNCPATCQWVDGDTASTAPGSEFGIGGDIGYGSQQRWGSDALVQVDFLQAFLAVKPAPAGSPADLGKPFLLSNMAHYNTPIRGDSPTHLGLQTLLTVQPPAGAPVVFHLEGDNTIPLEFEETVNAFPCDPAIQVSSTPCDDSWAVPDYTADVVADGVTWHFELLGWRTPQGTFKRQFTSEEMGVNQFDLYAQLTVDTNPTTSALTVDGSTSTSPVLTMTTTPVPQTGGTVTFTDGGTPIAGCTGIPVDAVDGATTCAPAGLPLGPHTFAGRFSGGVGYDASDAAPLDFSVLLPQTVSFDAPTGVTYGDADLALGATASSGLPVSYSSSTPDVCTTTDTGALHVVAAGTCTVTAAQPGDSTRAPAQQSRTFSIAKATLTVTADDQSRDFGSANPTLTATITGYVDGDPPSVVLGTPALSTTAGTDSAPGGYPIAVDTSGLTATNYDFVGVSGTLVINRAPTTTLLTATPNPAGLNRAVTLAATLFTSATGTAPSGTVAFYVDGAATSAASASVVDGRASALVILPGGAHTVVARYGGDDFYLPSVSGPPIAASVTCTQTISGRYLHSLTIKSGTTCALPGTSIAGSISVARGASLDLEGATVQGVILAVAPNAIRSCDSSAAAIEINGATGFVLIGDPEHGCAPNTIGGSMILMGNHAGLVAIDNTVGAVVARDNSGAGPLPGQTQPIIEGNHR